MVYVFGFFAALAVIGLIIDGIVLLFIHFWWVVVPALLLVAWGWYHHPGVRTKRELRVAAKRGNQMRQDIRSATEQAKADMDRIARDWKRL